MLGDLAGRPNADCHGREETPGELNIQRDEHDGAVGFDPRHLSMLVLCAYQTSCR